MLNQKPKESENLFCWKTKRCFFLQIWPDEYINKNDLSTI